MKKIDSTFYFFQYLFWRIGIVAAIGFFIYSIISEEIGVIIFNFLLVIWIIYLSRKLVPQPEDLNFDENFIYLDNYTNPIEIKKIIAIENGVLLYEREGKIDKISLPNYHYIDKNFKKLKRIIENRRK